MSTNKRSCLIALSLGLLLLASAQVYAVAASSTHSSDRVSQHVFPPFLPLDLDGDSKADHVTLVSCGYSETINIKLASERSSTLGFTTINGDLGVLIAYDIDGDTDPDLIWISSLDSKNSFIWINDGRANFTVASNTRYADRINELKNGREPSPPKSSTIRSREPRLTSPKSSDGECDPASPTRITTEVTAQFTQRPILPQQSPQLTHLRPRAPPFLIR